MERADHRIFWKQLNTKKDLNEGLITSWTNTQFKKFLTKLLDKYGFEYEVDKGFKYQTVLMKIFNLSEVSEEDKTKFFKDVQNLLNQSGFYPIYKRFNLDSFVTSWSPEYIMEFSKKFNTEKEVPEFLYHVTHPQYLKSILKKGLIPKTKNLIEDHPDRIYVTTKLKDAKTFAHAKYSITNDEDYVDYIILKIDTSKLGNIKLYVDALKIPGTGMYYILDNVPPSAIEVVKEGSFLLEKKIITKFSKFK